VRRVRRELAGIVLAVSLAALVTMVTPAAAHAAYAAIAVNPTTGATGVSWGFAKKARAKLRAKRECPGSCRIAVWVGNGCAAVVQSPTAYISGVGNSKRKATRKARRRAGYPNAPRIAVVCSG